MKRFYPVKDQPDLVKDAYSGAVININKTEIQRAKAAKEKRQKEKERLNQLESDVHDIKSMLQELLNKNGS